MSPAGGLLGFGELPPHEECAGVRGDEDHAFAWSGGPSFLAALDIVGPAMPVCHKPPRRRVENSPIPSLHFPPQRTTPKNPARSDQHLASPRLPIWRLRKTETFSTAPRQDWGIINLGASKTGVSEHPRQHPLSSFAQVFINCVNPFISTVSQPRGEPVAAVQDAAYTFTHRPAATTPLHPPVALRRQVAVHNSVAPVAHFAAAIDIPFRENAVALLWPVIR